jgi:hypothetical protein
VTVRDAGAQRMEARVSGEADTGGIGRGARVLVGQMLDQPSVMLTTRRKAGSMSGL